MAKASAQWRKDYYQKRKAMFVARLGGVCVECGTTEDLEIDHIDPSTKSFEILKCYDHKLDKVLSEVDKCQLLCKTHHKIKSDREASFEHGAGLTGKRFCYCDLCKPLKRARMKTWRAERKQAAVAHVG